jgi:hypothetical protein
MKIEANIKGFLIDVHYLIFSKGSVDRSLKKLLHIHTIELFLSTKL